MKMEKTKEAQKKGKIRIMKKAKIEEKSPQLRKKGLKYL